MAEIRYLMGLMGGKMTGSVLSRAPAGLLIEELRIVLQERWLQADRAKRRLRRSSTRWKKLQNTLTLEVPIVVMFVCGLLWPKAVLWEVESQVTLNCCWTAAYSPRNVPVILAETYH